MAAKLDAKEDFAAVVAARLKDVDARLAALRKTKVRHTKREKFYDDLAPITPQTVDVSRGASILRKYSVTAKRPNDEATAVLTKYSATKKPRAQ